MTNKKNITKLFALLMCVLLSMTLLTSCGGSDKTLEDYLSENTEAQEKIDASAEEIGATIEVKGSQISYVFKSEDQLSDDEATNMKSALEEAFDTYETVLKKQIDEIEKDSGINGVSFKIVYQNKDGETIYESEID